MNINPMDILKNAKKLQEQMGSIQQKMEDVTVTGRSGGGMVEVDMNGRMEINSVRIETAIIKPDNVEMLQDLIQAAFSDAINKVRDQVGAVMGNMVSGLGNVMTGNKDE
jgi:DNA-binding YbaB/EbfC family protein